MNYLKIVCVVLNGLQLLTPGVRLGQIELSYHPPQTNTCQKYQKREAKVKKGGQGRK